MVSDVRNWLQDLGFGKYVEAFASNDVGLDVLPYLTESHLREIGVSLGDRLRILKAIEAERRWTTGAGAGDKFGDGNEVDDQEQPSGSAERRHITVIFCDLADSTALSTRLDPEDLQDVIRAYQDVVSAAVRRFGGFVAKFMGDGILVYFGYPQAHEKDTESAVRASLAIIASMPALNAEIGKRHNVKFSVRIGVATGPVVVGDIIGEGAAEEAAVVGKTPNLAARLQAVALPDQVVIAATTRRLLGELFVYDNLGMHELKGIAEAVEVWRVVGESDVESLFAAEPKVGAVPLVGRQEELGLLLRSWETSSQGHGQIVLLQGEAGIGKSRLVQALRERVMGEPHTWIAIRCSPYHTNSMLYPVIEHLKRVMGWSPDDDTAMKFEKLQTAVAAQSMPVDEITPLLATLMSLPAEYFTPLDLTAAQMRERILDCLMSWLFEEAEKRPVLQVWEDLHWADPTTLEYAGLYVEQSPTAPMLNVLTYRTDFVPPWPMRSHITPITLNRMEQPEVEALILGRAGGKRMPSEVVDHIVAKADGVPLYAEELTKTILDSDYLREEADRFTLAGALSDFVIPASLQDSLMARLDRVPTLREVAQIGAVLGREFGYEMLRAVAGLEEPKLQKGLEQLVAEELLYQRGRLPRSRYIFKHALIQDAAYQSLLKRTRQQCHRRVAELLEEKFQDTLVAQPELAAHHYAEAGNWIQAAQYWLKAGERAREQSANLEAIAYFKKGIEAVHALPETVERDQLELTLQLSLGHTNIVAKGHGSAEAETAYARALVLCHRLGDVPELAPTLFGLWRFCVGARSLEETKDVALKISNLAAKKHDPTLTVISNYALGYTTLCQGNLGEARQFLEGGLNCYSQEQRRAAIFRSAQDPGVACGAYLGMTTWLLGRPQSALDRWQQSIRLAEELDDHFSLAFALCFVGAIIAEVSGGDLKSIVGRGLDVATEGGFSLWVTYGKVQQSFMRFREEPSNKILGELRECVDAISDIGVQINTPYYMTLLARAYHQARRFDDGLRTLDEARQRCVERGERWWEPEILRLFGEFVLCGDGGDSDNAQTYFEQALSLSKDQGAQSLELRAAMSLARFWQLQEKNREGCDMLKPIYDRFTEGRETADLKDARVLLSGLA